MTRVGSGPPSFSVPKGSNLSPVDFSGWWIPTSGRLFMYFVMPVVDVPLELYFFSFLPC